MDDEFILENQLGSPVTKYRALLSPDGRMATQSIFLDRNTIRFEF
jgi:hypothetical protein